MLLGWLVLLAVLVAAGILVYGSKSLHRTPILIALILIALLAILGFFWWAGMWGMMVWWHGPFWHMPMWWMMR